MVIFAVLVAFGVDNWRETRQLQRFAETARAAVEMEIEENWREFEKTRQPLNDLRDKVAAVVGAQSESDPVFTESQLDLTFSLPETSSAAWRTAQASQAAPYFDYNWIISVSRAYEMLGTYERMRDLMLDSLTQVLARMASGTHPLQAKQDFHRLNGRLLLVMQAHAEVQKQMKLLVD